MQIGERYETAIWLTGEEPQELRDQYEADVKANLSNFCQGEGFIHGPVTFTEKQPNEDRVPPVPDHIQGPNVRLLVAEAQIIARTPELKTRSFIGDLEQKDLDQLRRITRQRANCPLTDLECDDLIEALGPQAALATLKKPLQ